MASLSRPSSPASLQLRFSPRCGASPPVFLRLRFRPLDRRFGLMVSSGEAAGGERKEEPWNGSNWSPDSFAGWTATEGRGGEPPEKGSSGGVALAGLLFAAGVTFATLSLTNRNDFGSKQEMEPLTMEQERLLSSDNTNGNIYRDLILPSDTNEDAIESKSDDAHHMEAALVHNSKSAEVDSDSTETAFNQGDIKVLEDIDYIPIHAGFNTSTPELFTHVVDFSPDRSNLKDVDGTTYPDKQKIVT